MDTLGPVISAPTPFRAGKPRVQRLRVIAALMIREMATRHGRSSGGYLWAILEPLGGVLLLSFAFALALRSPPLGDNFMLFYATGIVPFTIFNTMSKGVAGAVGSNRGLLNYPVVTLLDAVFAKAVLSFMTQAMIGSILFTGIILGAGLNVTLDLGAAALALSMAALFGIGVGMINCVLFGFFPTWKNVWAVLTRPLFLVSGIFFIAETAPPKLREILLYNPIVHSISMMRKGFYGTYDPQHISLVYVFGVSMGLILLGGYLLRRHEIFLIEQ